MGTVNKEAARVLGDAGRQARAGSSQDARSLLPDLLGPRHSARRRPLQTLPKAQLALASRWSTAAKLTPSLHVAFAPLLRPLPGGPSYAPKLHVAVPEWDAPSG